MLTPYQELTNECFGLMVVSQRGDGTYWLLSDPDSVEAARWCGISQLRTLVYRGLTLEQEARYYHELAENEEEFFQKRFPSCFTFPINQPTEKDWEKN